MSDNLTMEQQFLLASARKQLENASQEQLLDFAVEIYKQMLIQQNLHKQLLAHQWGIDRSGIDCGESR